MKISPGKEKYYEEYLTLIEEADLLDYQEQDTYFEKHHIIPHSLGGSNDKSNLVRLTASDHFKCHYFLVNFLEDGSKEQYKMVCALNLLMRIGPTAENYQIIKEKNIKLLTEYRRGVVSARDKKTREVVRITKETFILNSDKYEGITKNKVPVVDKDGNSFSVYRDDPRFLDGSLQHHLKGRRYLYHPNLKRYTSILKKDLDKYLEDGWVTNIPKIPTNLKWFYNTYSGDQKMAFLTEHEIELWGFFGWIAGRGKSIKLYNPNTKKCNQVPLSDKQKYLDNGWIKKHIKEKE